jgi:hypothetical protein
MQRAATARTNNLIIERLDDEVLVFDELTSTGHALTPLVGRVFDALDGSRTTSDLARLLRMSEADVDAAIDELERLALVVVPAGYSRRELSKKAAKVALVAPLAYSVAVAPAAAQGTIQCTARPCAGTGSSENQAQSAANTVCANAGCGTCNGTVGGVPNARTYSGLCRNP